MEFHGTDTSSSMEFHGTYCLLFNGTIGISNTLSFKIVLEFYGIWVSKFWWKLHLIVPDELISEN